MTTTPPVPPALLHASRNPETTRVDMKVLIRLHETLNVFEFRPVRPWHIANLITVEKSSVTRSLLHLEELGYVERGPQCGNGNFAYRLKVPQNGNGSPPPLSSCRLEGGALTHRNLFQPIGAARSKP